MKLNAEIIIEEIHKEVKSIREWLDMLKAQAEQEIDPDTTQEARRHFTLLEGGAANDCD